MTPDRLALLGGACASLLAVSAGGMIMLRSSARSQRLAQRMNAVVMPHTRMEAPTQARQAARRTEPDGIGWRQRLEILFGCTAERREASKSRWWIVVPAALLIARLLVEVAVAMAGPIALLATPVLWIMISRMWWKRAENARRTLLYQQFPDTLGMIVRAVRVGIPVSEAIRGAAREQPAPSSIVFGALSNQLTVGMPLEEALRNMADRCGVAEYRFFATALTLQAQTGGGLTETLENLADVIRKRLALKARAAALAGEAKMSAGILAVLPLIAAGALVVLNPDYIMLLIDDPTGNKVLAAAVLMLGGGIMSMRMLIRKALS